MKLDNYPHRCYRTLILSDIHLGTADCKAEQLLDFLKHVHCQKLILNGDIVDFWALRRGGHWRDTHTHVLRQILKMAQKRQTRVIYIRGNHDDIPAELLPVLLDKISFRDQYELRGACGKRYLCIHGDVFDSVTTHMRWLAVLGDIGYQQLLRINRFYNRWRAWRGKPYYSLSQAAKHRVKGAVNFISRFEAHLIHLAGRKGVDGIICGHIHHPEMRTVGNIEYLNSGDWVESMSALGERFDGTFDLIHYAKSMAPRLLSLPEENATPAIAV